MFENIKKSHFTNLLRHSYSHPKLGCLYAKIFIANFDSKQCNFSHQNLLPNEYLTFQTSSNIAYMSAWVFTGAGVHLLDVAVVVPPAAPLSEGHAAGPASGPGHLRHLLLQAVHSKTSVNLLIRVIISPFSFNIPLKTK